MSIKKNKKTSLILSLFLVFGILGPVQSVQESDAEVKKLLAEVQQQNNKINQLTTKKTNAEAEVSRLKTEKDKLFQQKSEADKKMTNAKKNHIDAINAGQEKFIAQKAQEETVATAAFNTISNKYTFQTSEVTKAEREVTQANNNLKNATNTQKNLEDQIEKIKRANKATATPNKKSNS